MLKEALQSTLSSQVGGSAVAQAHTSNFKKENRLLGIRRRSLCWG